ncbi:unnamed protein product [Tuber aestivum]|uniref:Uncharacterized protein n=1 Tax=Tuber aestivum TaxID=59557 RepID=A0A292Q0M1_9PEZI|nr:unnamed protein product [Tuber aestivum]
MPKFKGGQWEDRLKAKNAVKHHAKKRATIVKRRRGDETPKQTPAPQVVQTGEFVSFLCTGNPAASSAITGDEGEEGEGNEPLNAQLVNGYTIFPTLRLSPVLANHLKTKQLLKAPTTI